MRKPEPQGDHSIGTVYYADTNEPLVLTNKGWMDYDEVNPGNLKDFGLSGCVVHGLDSAGNSMGGQKVPIGLMKRFNMK